MVTEIIASYDVDGLHLDYVRFPDSTYSYDEISTSAYRSYAPYAPQGMTYAMWRAAQLTILRAMGPDPVDEEGMAKRYEKIRKLDLMRLDEDEFLDCRKEMIATCGLCHSERFAKDHLENMDRAIRESALLVAEAVEVVEGLYREGLLPRGKDEPEKLDLLRFYENPTPIEQELYHMLFFYRQRLYQGVAHSNPDYAHWKGWGPMKTSLVKIRALAESLRERTRR